MSETTSTFTQHYVDYKDDKGFATAGAEIAQQVRTLFDGGAVTRFHTMPTVKQNTVAEHSHGVAMFCILMLGRDVSTNLLAAALTHDLAEQYVGDVPSPSKRLLDIRGQLHDAEQELLRTVDMGYEHLLTEDESVILKLADCADGMMFCARERMLGNRSKMLKHAYKNYGGYVHTLMQSMPFGARSQRVAYVFASISKLWKENKGE